MARKKNAHKVVLWVLVALALALAIALANIAQAGMQRDTEAKTYDSNCLEMPIQYPLLNCERN